MRSLPLPSPRLARALVAALLVGGVASLPLVADDDDDARVAALAGLPGTDDETPDILVDVPDTTQVPAADDVVGAAPTVPRPKIPKVTVPPVTAPTLPPVTVPSLLDQRAKAACIAAVDGQAPPTATLADTGAYTAAPDGSGVKRVVRSDDPGTWDGPRRRLAYQVEIVHTWTSALCVLEGSTVHLAGTLQPSGCCMSPGAMQVWTTGDELVATDMLTNPVMLRVYDARGGPVRRSFPVAQPYSVSPDGRRLAYLTGSATPHQELLIADLSTGVVHTRVPLDDLKYSAWALRWLPDSSGIGFLTDGLHVLDIATRTRRTLVGDNVGQYAFAPDGRVAYTTYLRGDGPGRVFVTAPDGSGAAQVADGPVRYIAWSPQGDRLLLAASHDNDAYLETVRTDGSERRVVARAAARKGEHWLRFVVNTGWSPDGSRIEFGLIRDPGVSSIAT